MVKVMGGIFMANQPYNKQWDEEIYRQVNDYNKEALDDWLLELQVQGKTEKTIYQYTRNVKLFFIWIYKYRKNKPISELKKKDFRNYLLYLKDLDLSPARINSMKSAVSSFLTYLSEEEDYEDDVNVNYMQKLKSIPKEEVREVVFLTEEECKIIYNKLKLNKKYTELLLLARMYESGARRNELYQLEVRHIDLNANETTDKVVGKRKKKFTLFYGDWTKEAFKLYMENRPETECQSLWVNEEGEQYSYDWIYFVAKTWNKIIEDIMKYNPNLTAHSLRHSFAQNMFDGTHHIAKGKPISIATIQIMMHHTDMSTTQSYLKPMDSSIVTKELGWDE